MKITKVDNGKFKASFKQNINNSPLENQTDKYLYDRDKTIGFRKDKKLFKFVGIRDGYSKQLELTLESIIIDGDEKIASNRVNFSDLSVSGDTLIHNINGLEFYNNIDLTSYKNLVKIDQDFTDIEILYEVHTKGIKIEENGYTNNGIYFYRQNHLGQFKVIDEGNNNLLFCIENPVAFDENKRRYNIVSHNLYKDGDKLYYKKTANKKLDHFINFPLYIDANITFGPPPIEIGNIKSYNYNNSKDLSWSGAVNGVGDISIDTDSSSSLSVNSRNVDLLSNWINIGTWDWDLVLSDPHKISYASGSTSSIAYSSLKESYSGETIIINFPYSAIGPPPPNEFYPDFYIREYDSGATFLRDTYYSITGTNYYTWNHTMGTDTSYFNVYVDSTGSGGDVYFNTTGTSPGEINIYRSGVSTGTTYYYESNIDRQFLYFDTSQLYQIAINKMELNFTLSSPSSGDYVIQKANTVSDTSISTVDFNNYQGDPYTEFSATVTGFTLDLGQDIIDDFEDKSVTKLVIREKDYDYNSLTPTNPYSDTITHNWTYGLDVELGKFIVTGATILDFGLESNGFGVIYSQGTSYNDAYSGLTSTTVVHTSTSGTYDSGATYIYDLSYYELYRTFLNFDTSILTIYDRYIIKDIKLIIKNYNYNDDISICEGLQDTASGLTNTEFMSFGDHYVDVEGITLNSSVQVSLDEEVLNTSGNTLFVIRNKVYDYEGNSTLGIFSSLNGMDFSQTYLEVELEPYLIYGINYIRVEKGTEIDLHASRNTTDGEIFWGTDSGITNVLGSGNTLHLNTINYNAGDYIYAAILDVSGNTISINVLKILLDLYDLHFNNLPERNFNDHDVDLDAVYFKYHHCLSGTTYAYARELDDVYEHSIEVSDGEGLGSYNMYNEWDIIDEFFSNSHEVEVVGKLDEIDLNVSYKRINDIYIHEGTRVLLYSTIPSENDGVYVADFNLKLHKTGELDDADLAFRYKAHVQAGEYLDYEFHTKFYTPEPPSPDPFDFDYLDPEIYGDLVIDLGVDPYFSVLFDSNAL